MAFSPDAFGHGSLFAFPIVLAGGLLAGFNPCCVAMYPAAAASCCSVSNESRHGWLVNTSFVLGAASTTAGLGMIAALLGRIVGQFGTTVRYAVAFVPMLMAFYLLGWLRLPVKQVPVKSVGSGLLKAFLAGVFLAVLISPCGTPILASVLSYAAYKGSIFLGMALLFVYGLGNSTPIVLLGSAATAMLKRNENIRLQTRINSVSAVLLIVTSFYLIWKV